MTAGRGRQAVWIGAGALLLCLAIGAYLLRGFVVEQLAIRDLRSADPWVVSAALEKLASLRSHDAVPAILKLYKDREGQRPATEADDDDPTSAMELVRAAARIGPRALAEV